MKIAVTAASGHLGSAIVKAITALQGTEVVALARTPANAVDLGVEVCPGNCDEPDELEKSLQSGDRRGAPQRSGRRVRGVHRFCKRRHLPRHLVTVGGQQR